MGCRWLLVLLMTTAAFLAYRASGLQFSEDPYVVEVLETPAGDADSGLTPPDPVTGHVLTVTCTHSDGTPVADPSDLRYSITSGAVGLFSIDATSGEFSVADVPFDYEENQLYLVHLLCYLDSDRNSNGTGEVRVAVGPVNEYLPEIAATSPSGSVQVHENIPVGTVIAALNPGEALFTYTATDRDSGPDGVIIYNLTAEDSFRVEQFFNLDQHTGAMVLAQELDVDDLPGDNPFERLDISITACNEGISFDSCEQIPLTVYILAANDSDPAFLQSQYTASVSESAPNGTLVAQVECEDEDKGRGEVEGISFEQETSSTVLAAFEVNSAGAILLRDQLDYENTTSYQFTLVCSDGSTTATTQVTVDVLPVNDNDPLFLQSQYTASISESASNGAQVAQVECEDKDIGRGKVEEIFFERETSLAVLAAFEVNSAGTILLRDQLDYENTTSYQFTLVCSDGFTNATTHVTVTVLPVNDNAPSFLQDPYAGCIVVIAFIFWCFI